MNPEYMCIEEASEPSPFHGQFDFWESVCQDNSMHFCNQCSNFDSEHLEMSCVYKKMEKISNGQTTPFTEAVSS